MIGAVDWDAWDEATLRKRIAEHPLVEADREQGTREHLAVVQGHV